MSTMLSPSRASSSNTAVPIEQQGSFRGSFRTQRPTEASEMSDTLSAPEYSTSAAAVSPPTGLSVLDRILSEGLVEGLAEIELHRSKFGGSPSGVGREENMDTQDRDSSPLPGYAYTDSDDEGGTSNDD